MLRGGMTIEPKRAFRLFSKPLTPTRSSLEFRRAAFFSGSFIVSLTTLRRASLGSLLLLPGLAIASEGMNGAELSLPWAIPFAGILLSIALFPLFLPSFWHHHFGKVSLFWAAACAIPLGIAFGASAAFDEVIHISDADMIVEGAHAPFSDPPEHPATAEDTAIANLLLPHICDGATVQLGIGGMPTVLGKLLARSGLHDLGMHTELCSDAYLELHEAGVLTNRRCTLHRNQGMLGITIGSKRLYDWVDDNPGVIAAPLSYVNAPEVIAQLDNMVSINSCIAADLYGQVASESSGLRQISGTGGQLDFLTGAAMARGGKAFICMTSTFTDRDGVRHSRILPHFGGDIVTSPRAQAYYLATEQGVVNLAGRSTWERAEALVSIAHPDFRDELIRAAEAQKIWRRSAKR